MSSIEFNYEGILLNIPCNPDEKIGDIIARFLIKINKKKSDYYFIYGGGTVKENLTFIEHCNNLDKERKKMSFLVNKVNKENADEEICLKKSKYIICPICKDKSRISIDNYKIGIYDCKNGHKNNNILIHDFESTQNIDEKKIKCQNCNMVDKTTSYQNIFFICFDCQKSLCRLCRETHDKTHNIIDYDDKFFTCDIHYESYISYCENCKRDICLSCEMEHGEHKVTSYGSILPNLKKVKEENSNLFNKKEQFKNDIKEIINKLNNLIENIDSYFKIYEDIINSYGNKKRNYYLLKNIHDISLFNNNFIQDMNKIINEIDLKHKINNIIDIYNKINNINENMNQNIEMIKEGNNTNIREDNKQIKIQEIKPILGKIISQARDNTIKNYRNNEDMMRNYIEPNKNEETKKNYFDNLIMQDNSLANLIMREERLKNVFDFNYESIENKDEEKKTFELLVNEYYTFYLNKYLNKKHKNKNNTENNISNNNLDNNKKYLCLMVEIRNNIINSYLNKNDIPKSYIFKFASIINWLESYSEEMIIFQNIFLKLNNKIPKLYELIESIISSNQINYGTSKIPENNSIINKVFYLSLDSILLILTTNSKIYELPLNDLLDLIKIIKEVLESSLQLEIDLQMKSKEISTLKEIIEIFNTFELNNLINVKNVQKIIQYFNEENIYLNQDLNDKLCSNIKIFYEYLIKTMGNISSKNNFDFYKFLSLILFYEFKKVENILFRECILQIILEKNDLIKYSSKIITIILDNANIKCFPDEFENNIENIRKQNSKMFLLLNYNKNEFLEQIIMNIFERKISKYFELIPILDEKNLKLNYKTYYEQNKGKIKNKIGIIFDKSFNIFKNIIKILDEISVSDKKNENLLKLYSIVYVKMYLYYLSYFIINNYHEIKSVKNIINIINDLKNKHFSKVIKIYIIKLLFNLKNISFEEFDKLKFEKYGIDFYNVFKENKNENNIKLTYNFLPSDFKDFNSYEEIINSFYKIDKNNLGIILDKYGLDMFLSVVINKIISNLVNPNFDQNELYINFSNYIKEIFNQNNKNYNNELSQLLLLFSSIDKYNKNIKQKIINGDINVDLFEALLYGLRFCVNSLNFDKRENKNKFLFSSILSKNCEKVIESSLIPGNDINNNDLHLLTLEKIQEHFKILGDNYGCYVCSCGFYYSINPSGFPTTNHSYNCPGCGKRIGWGPKVIKDRGAPNHGMVIRPGHYRLFRDMKQKKEQMSMYEDPDENIPNMIYDDYIKKVIEPIKNQIIYGFIPVECDYFEMRDKKIRNLSKIGYRLLNFISYNYLFYSFCIENISQKQLNKYLIKNCDILKIIKTDWNLLKEELKEKNIMNIQAFLNMIFKDLSKLLNQCPILKKNLDREKFENEVEEIISKNIEKYPNYNKIYQEENLKLLKLDNIENLKNYILELIPTNSESFSSKEYPLFKYFNYTKYKSEIDMINKMKDKENYPLIRKLYEDNPEVKKLDYLLEFNEFNNYMLNHYSFKISREDAKKTILKKEDIYKDKEFIKKFNKFLNIWNHIKSEAVKYKCVNQMEVKNEFRKNATLINYLNDDKELYNGMYLASAYQNFIEWQNQFLEPIIEANNSKGILHHFIHNISKKIQIQDVRKNQIILTKNLFDKNENNFIDFKDVIYAFSERNIFGKDGKINYLEYNNFIYDYDKIEEELGKILLSGAHLFNSENELNFIIYLGEAFRGKNSETISKFLSKYSQKDFDVNEKEIVLNYIKNMNQNNKFDYKNFFCSLQIILFYLSNNVVMKDDEKISNIVKNVQKYPVNKLSFDFIAFCNNEGKNLALNKFMNLFLYFEHLCFLDLIKILQTEYKLSIPENIKQRIKEKLLLKNSKINTKDLAAATRRLISRYLVGNIQLNDIKEDGDLAFQLSREELWDERNRKLDNLMELIIEDIGEFNLKVGQVYEFYNLIGDEDKRELFN